MDYKDTLLLPKTDFPMRGNLPQNEPKRYQKWFRENVYERMKKNREGKELFTLHDGPPYANGDIHIGHALNKILKDIIVKFHYFSNKAVRFTPGWDCHGLPIEQKVEEKIGKEKKESMKISEFRALCREHAAKYIKIQMDGFKSLGVIADWEKPYITMDYKFEANIYRALCEIAKKDLLIERSKPVFWSWAAKSALADAEVEYKDKEDYSIYVAFELSDKAKKELDLPSKAAIVIWTTTPWTLPSNVAIAIHPKEEYILSSDGYIVAKSRFDELVNLGIIKAPGVRVLEPKDLENKIAINPLNQRSSQIILADFVELDGGSGAVHSAPGHGEVDYFAALKYNLDVIMPVDDEGRFDESVVELNLLPNPQEFVGMHVFKANDKILDLLGDALLYKDRFVHSYPHCWRTKKPVIYRATKQWFIAVDKEPKGADKTLRKIALDGVEKTKFYPSWGKNRLKSMVENRPDWCISRQRSWGVPIAFFRDKKTKEVILDEKVLNFIAAIFEREGCDAWYDRDIKELLHPASGYNPDDLEKITDILDVWFDSGSTWYCVLTSKDYDAGNYPASIYLEGSDQHRGWFQSSLFVSSAINFKPPYYSILTHGFTVDEKGEKMSKSKGNVVSPKEVTKSYGSEILRLWVALSDYQSDLKISQNILKQIAEQYRKIRNSFRFLLANVYDLEKLIDNSSYTTLDKWAIAKAKRIFTEVNSEFNNYEFARGFSKLNYFLTNELSGIYMDICKDRLYCEAKESSIRRSAQSVMAQIARSMLGLVAPVLTYTADEVLDYAPNIIKKEAKDIFDFVYEPISWDEEEIDDEFALKAREAFYEEIDRLRKEKIIKATLEVEIVGDDSHFPFKDKDLEDWFVVSGFVKESDGERIGKFVVDEIEFDIVKSQNYKCPRCWRYKATKEGALCDRCQKVVNG